jgi:hypothetical protein
MVHRLGLDLNIYALTFTSHTRLIPLGNELLIGPNTSFPTPLFRHILSSIAFSICARLINVRLTRTLLAIASLLTPSITASLPSASHFWLRRFISLAHEAFLSQPFFLTLAACRWPRSPGRTCYPTP